MKDVITIPTLNHVLLLIVEGIISRFIIIIIAPVLQHL